MTVGDAMDRPCIGPAPDNTGWKKRPADPFFACRGARCLAWRVATLHAHQENEMQAERPEGDGWERTGTFWARTVPRRELGYCGLAGAP